MVLGLGLTFCSLHWHRTPQVSWKQSYKECTCRTWLCLLKDSVQEWSSRMVFQRVFAFLAVAVTVCHGDGEDCSSGSYIQKHSYRFGPGSSEKFQCSGSPASGVPKAPNVLEAIADTGADKGPHKTSISAATTSGLPPLSSRQASSFWKSLPRGGLIARVEQNASVIR